MSKVDQIFEVLKIRPGRVLYLPTQMASLKAEVAKIVGEGEAPKGVVTEVKEVKATKKKTKKSK